MNPTIRDVARKAGVGVATVSRVLNSSGYVRPETRDRVLKAAADLRFVPSQLARGLVNRASETIGLIMPDITNPFFPTVIRGGEDAANLAGYTVFLCNTDNDPAREESYVQKLREHRVDGVIFLSTSSRPDLVERLLADDIQVAAALRPVGHFAVDTVMVDNLTGAHDACLYLIELGHTRIAHVAGASQTRPGQDRHSGYRWALQEAGIPYDESLVLWGDFTYDSGYALGQTLLGRCPRPTAIFAGNDLMAFGVIRAAEEAGVRMPEQLSIIGFDDIRAASSVYPGLTTVRQPAYEIGRLAMNMLLERIHNEYSGDARKHLFQAQLVARGTTSRRESRG